MTIQLDHEPEVEDFLEHHGVKGMRWGVRREKVSNADIKAARRRIDHKTGKDFDKLGKIEDRYHSAKSPGARAKAEKDLKREENAQRMEHLKNPDRATAMRMTTGEKAALVIIGGVLTGGAPAIAYGVGRMTARKVVEKKQRSGSYDKKK